MRGVLPFLLPSLAAAFLHAPIKSGIEVRAVLREIEVPKYNSSRTWSLNNFAFSLLPLSPRDQRATLCEEVVKGRIWTLDQIQGIIMVKVYIILEGHHRTLGQRPGEINHREAHRRRTAGL